MTEEPKIMRTFSIMRPRDAQAQKAELIEASITPGVQRSRFVAALSKANDDTHILAIQYGQSHVALNAHGDAVLDVDSESGKPRNYPVGVNQTVCTALAGSAPANKVIGKTVIPCGVVLILGVGGTGKTPLAHALASAGVSEYGVVRVGEPLAGYASDQFSACGSLAGAILACSDIVLDSIKDLLSSGGNAMKSGVSRGALTSISGWATIACDAGSTIYVPVNASTNDPEVFEMLAEASRSNATMVIRPDGGENWSFIARRGEGLSRVSGTFKLRFDKVGVPSITSTSDASDVSEEDAAKFFAASVDFDTMTNAVRRTFINQTEQ